MQSAIKDSHLYLTPDVNLCTYCTSHVETSHMTSCAIDCILAI